MMLVALCVGEVPPRPALIAHAAPDDVVHYFGVGSNMLKSKLVNRGLNGTKIEVMDIQPAIVKAHRLAFNMRGFPPLEPGMGALEPCDAVGERQTAHECHGALCTMTAKEYEKVWLSEGGGQPNPGYEEIVVQATPYGASTEQTVSALAFRARPHVRLPIDACPSARYMDILITGATELGLRPSYIDELKAIQVQQVGPVLRTLAVHYLFLFTTLFKLKARWLIKAFSWCLWHAYVPSTCKKSSRRFLGGVATGLLLLPGAFIGALIRLSLVLTKTPPSPMLAVMIAPKKAAAQPAPSHSAVRQEVSTA